MLPWVLHDCWSRSPGWNTLLHQGVNSHSFFSTQPAPCLLLVGKLSRSKLSHHSGHTPFIGNTTLGGIIPYRKCLIYHSSLHSQCLTYGKYLRNSGWMLSENQVLSEKNNFLIYISSKPDLPKCEYVCVLCVCVCVHWTSPFLANSSPSAQCCFPRAGISILFIWIST